jgi:hypothetical protein
MSFFFIVEEHGIMDIPSFVYALIGSRTFGCLNLLVITNNVAMNIHVQVLSGDTCFAPLFGNGFTWS